MDGASNKRLVKKTTVEIKNWSEKTINKHYCQILSEWSNQHIAIRYTTRMTTFAVR